MAKKKMMLLLMMMMMMLPMRIALLINTKLINCAIQVNYHVASAGSPIKGPLIDHQQPVACVYPILSRARAKTEGVCSRPAQCQLAIAF